MEINIPDNIIKGVISSKKKDSKYEKCHLKRVTFSHEDVIQFSLYTEKQVFHTNVSLNDVKDKIIELLDKYFNNMELQTSDYTYGYRITSKGKVLSNKHLNKEKVSLVDVNNNRKKKYLIEEGTIVEPLIDLGVMMKDGKVTKAQYDKFRQINRFLEIIDDNIKDERSLNIIDFGCGKSYLTFILYYYLVRVKKMDVKITGLDLKEEVIHDCNKLAEKYGYKNLHFYCGDIKDYAANTNIDMIVTLHACDTATDFALYHAINMHVKYIFSVPCCQHEINNNIETTYMHSVTKFGILKERLSAILTDAIRANILQYYGYKTQVMEFVDIENSPKNLLVRAILTNNKNTNVKKEIDSLMKELNTPQTLYDLCFKNNI